MRTLLALLMLCTSAYAGPNDARWDPPAQYDKEWPAEHLIEYKVSPGEVARRCARWEHDKNLFKRYAAWTRQKRGCAFPRGKKCWIVYIDRPAYGTTPGAVRAHEMGHCWGWKHASIHTTIDMAIVGYDAHTTT